ncbi:MAG: YitT family protein [Lachnospiraceae bacterium]
MQKEKLTVSRIGIYLSGVVMVSLGIVLCKKCNLGISPISSIPYVLEDLLPLTFGTLTMLFHFVNIAFQMILAKKILDLKLFLQIPLAFIFGVVIDFIQEIVHFDETVLLYQIIALILSVFFTALGMVCMLSMNLIQNPPDGAVREISHISGNELGKVKISYDLVCVGISLIIGLIFLKSPKGFGIATIISAVFVGKTVTWLKKEITRIQNFKVRKYAIYMNKKNHA